VTPPRTAIAVLVPALATQACHLGVSATKFAPAREPAGIVARLALNSHELAGEVLVADEGRLLVVCRERRRLVGSKPLAEPCRQLVFVPYALIRKAWFVQFSHVKLEGGRPPSTEVLNEIRLLSRYPQGLTSDVFTRLVAAYGQTAVEEEAP